MAFPTQKKIKKVLQKLEGKEGTQAPPANPTPLEKFRWDIQQKFVVYKNKNKISQREMCVLLGVDEAKVSKILRNHLEDFSTDRLITLYEKLNPNIKIRVS